MGDRCCREATDKYSAPLSHRDFLRCSKRANAAEPLEMVRVVKDAVDAFTGSAPRADDVAALALRWQPAEAAAARPIEWAGA
jgi:hypothetical protein